MQVILLDLGGEMRGGQRQVLYLARFLNEHPEYAAEFSPVIACPASSPLCTEAKKSGITVLPLRGKRFWNPLIMLQLQSFVKQQIGRHHKNASAGPALLIHSNDANAASLGAMMSKGNPLIRLMHTRRVSYPLRSGKRAAKYLQADLITAVSAEIGDVLVHGGVSKDRIRVVHSGIDPALYLTREKGGKKLREPNERATGGLPETGIAGTGDIPKLRFVIVGALTKQKGHEVLFRAVRELTGNPALQNPPMPNFEVRIFGEGPLSGSLRELAASLGIKDAVSFMGHQDCKKELCHCDILLSPSVDGEGSSATIKEGWAVGLPVIASDLASNLELVEDGKDGLVVKTGDPLSLAQSMRKLALAPTLRESLANNGKKKLENFTSAAMAKSYISIYRELRTLPGIRHNQASPQNGQ